MTMTMTMTMMMTVMTKGAGRVQGCVCASFHGIQHVLMRGNCNRTIRVWLLMRCECSEHGGVRAHLAGRCCDSLRVAIVRLWDMNQSCRKAFYTCTNAFY